MIPDEPAPRPKGSGVEFHGHEDVVRNVVLAAQPETRRRNEAESGIEGGMANDDNRPGARLPAGGQPGAHQARTDSLALAIGPHGHRRQSEDSLIGETVQRHRRKEDVAGDRIVVVGDQ